MKDNSQCKWCVQRARCQASHRRPSGTLLLGKYRKYRKQMHDNEPRYCWKCCYFRISLRSSVTNNHSHRFARIIKNRTLEKNFRFFAKQHNRFLVSIGAVSVVGKKKNRTQNDTKHFLAIISHSTFGWALSKSGFEQKRHKVRQSSQCINTNKCVCVCCAQFLTFMKQDTTSIGCFSSPNTQKHQNILVLA